MIRKTVSALAVAAALAVVAMSPTAASAKPFKKGPFFGGPAAIGIGLGVGLLSAAAMAAAPTCYFVREVVDTPYGPEVRRVRVCD